MNDVMGTLTEPLVEGQPSIGQITRDICAPLERRAGALWWGCFIASASALVLGLFAVTYQIKTGIGTWGLNKTVGWAFDITNFVFWIGIGHAGTAISAILLLLRQKWRTSISRSAEAMTIFAVICAAIFPLIHMGRPWLAFWMLPYPNTRGSLWVNFRSPLLWDVFAIGTYFTISLVFWFVGLVPDLATLRDRATRPWRQKLYSVLSLGWTGSTRVWKSYESLYLILAGLATPLVISVHSIVSFDFATSILPGWHATIFPPYFVAGAIFSGFAMVLTLMLIARRVMRFEKYITAAHVDAMCKIVLGTGGLVALAYFTELYMAWQSGNWHERFALGDRAFGSFAWAYRAMVICNVFVPQFFWFKKIRRNLACVFGISLLVNVGMWLERFVIIVTSLHRDFLPSSWAEYSPTLIEIATLIGSFGLFFTLFLLFCRLLPVIGIAEIKAVVGSPDEQEVIETARANRAQPQEVYTPYPVHGLPEAMRLKPSRLPWIAFLFGCIGGLHALVLQFYESAIAWPVNVGGRPFNSLPAFVPVTFEVTVLFAGLGTLAVFLIRHRLYPGKKPARLVTGATDDRFVVLAKTKERA